MAALNICMVTHTEHIVLKLLSNALEPAGLDPAVQLHDHAQNRSFSGRQEVLDLFHTLLQDALSGSQLEISTFIADQRAAAAEFVLTGRHTGQFLGIPASGRQLSLAMTLICQLHDGVILAATLYYDAGALLRQIGLG